MSQDKTEPKTPANAETASSGAPPRRRKRALRLVLLVLGPLLVLVAGAYLYLTSGRYVGTENAYVKSDKVVVSPEVAGPITRVDVRENQRVEAGDVLFVIDDRPYHVTVEGAEAQLHAVESFLNGLKASYRRTLEQLSLARTNLAYAQRELNRQRSLAERQLASDSDVDKAQHDVEVAQKQIPITEQSLAQIRAQLGGASDVSLATQPAYIAMKARRDSAALDLKHTVVRAPFAGVASKVPVAGQYVAPGSAVMSIVKDYGVWVEANFKETDLTHVCPGQSVSIHVDTYPDREWHGRVESISEATGAEFSVIPPQNATGNWVKITQRIPIRIAVPVEEDDPVLRSDMSATVEIDTGFKRALPKFLPLGNAAEAGTAPMPAASCGRTQGSEPRA
jgi:membrane fusion protein (multidrug efflux system)